MSSIFQYRSVLGNTEDGKIKKPYSLVNLEKNQVYLTKVNDVNDPYEGIHNYDVLKEHREAFCKFFYQYKYNKKMIDDKNFYDCISNVKLEHVKTFLETGISCFSKKNDSLLMWGHYADAHKGICIEFNSNESIFKELIEVEYVSSPYTITIDSGEKLRLEFFDRIAKNIVATKHESWEYEHELRLIGNVGESYNYSVSSIIAIYFGSKVVENTICDVYYSSCHIPNIKYYYMELEFDNYKMKPIDITERCHLYAEKEIWIKEKFKSDYE